MSNDYHYLSTDAISRTVENTEGIFLTTRRTRLGGGSTSDETSLFTW